MAIFFRRVAYAALGLLLATGPVASAAAPADDPGAVINAFDESLLSVMKSATKLGYEGRYKALAPVIDRTFDVPLMTRIVVGSAWAGWTQQQRDNLIAAFRRFIVATYARRFDGWSGESFKFGGTRPVTGGTLVMTQIVRPDDSPVTLNYLTRPSSDGQYKAVDVFLTGTISELATRRSEFGAVLSREGYSGLLQTLEKKATNQAEP